MARSITFEEFAAKDSRGEYVGSLWDSFSLDVQRTVLVGKRWSLISMLQIHAL